jgi:hypothetical protein
VQVGQEATAGSVFGVGHVVAALRTLTRDLTYSGHCSKPRKKARQQREGRTLYQKQARLTRQAVACLCVNFHRNQWPAGMLMILSS